MYESNSIAKKLTEKRDERYQITICDTILSRYDPLTGKFMADRAGLYYFIVHLLSKENQGVNNETNFYIQKNEEAACVAYLEILEGTNLNVRSTCSATIELMPGDEVYVDCGNVHTLATGANHITFTGFLIQPYL